MSKLITPGPWQAVLLADGKTWGVTADVEGSGQTFLTIASLDHVPPEIASNEANARLMALSPLLLADLEETVDWMEERATVIERIAKGKRKGSLTVEVARLRGRAFLLRMTIARATGETL